MGKHYLLIIIPLLLGIGCFATFNMIGSEVTPDGALIEPFALLALGYFFFFVGVIALIVIIIKSALKKK